MSDSLLKGLAGIGKRVEPIRVEIVSGEALEFRPPTEGEIEEARKDAEGEAESYYKDGYQPTVQQKTWLPLKRETFTRATILSKFLITEGKVNEARRLLCIIGKNSPITFGVIFTGWQNEAVNAEIKAFALEVESRKNSLAKTAPDSSD